MKDTMILKRKDGLMAADMNGDTVMMDVATGKYYNLGSVGGEIWKLLENEMTVEALIAKLTAEYDVSAEQCRKDTMPFLEKMVKNGLFVAK